MFINLLSDWKSNGGGPRERLLCLVCNDGIWRQTKHCPRHASTYKHIEALKCARERNQDLDCASDGVLSRNLDLSLTPHASKYFYSGSTSSGAVGFLGNTLRLMSASAKERIDFEYDTETQLYTHFDEHGVNEDEVRSQPEIPSGEYDFAGITLEPSIYESISSQASDALVDWLAKGPSVDALSDSDENNDTARSEPDSESDEYTPGKCN